MLLRVWLLIPFKGNEINRIRRRGYRMNLLFMSLTSQKAFRIFEVVQTTNGRRALNGTQYQIKQFFHPGLDYFYIVILFVVI